MDHFPRIYDMPGHFIILSLPCLGQELSKFLHRAMLNACYCAAVAAAAAAAASAGHSPAAVAVPADLHHAFTVVGRVLGETLEPSQKLFIMITFISLVIGLPERFRSRPILRWPKAATHFLVSTRVL